MGKLFSTPIKLSDFQKEKLLHEFHMYYDLDGDGFVKYVDFELAKEFICKLNDWKDGSEKEQIATATFKSIWETLTKLADKDKDDKISRIEWLRMWEHLYEKILQDLPKGEIPSIDNLPLWCYRCIQHRFHMFDRTGDGRIDAEEFEYIISQFEVPAPAARKAFLLLSKNNERVINFLTFCQLTAEFYFSDDPASLGNFISGKIDWKYTVHH